MYASNNLRIGMIVAALGLGVATGCSDKEKVFEAEGPRREIEVERDKNTGEIQVEVERK